MHSCPPELVHTIKRMHSSAQMLVGSTLPGRDGGGRTITVIRHERVKYACPCYEGGLRLPRACFDVRRSDSAQFRRTVRRADPSP